MQSGMGLKTHLKLHLLDWIALIALCICYAALKIIHPYRRFVADFFIDDFRFPLKSNTVPPFALPIIGIGIPIIFFVAYYIYKRDIRDLHQAVLGLLYAFLLTALITQVIKNAVGRPRPDFFWRCFPDGIGVYDSITHGVLCTGHPAIIKEGYKSFPSGHTSSSFAGLGYLSFYFAGKLKVLNHRGNVSKCIIALIPLFLASLVGITRLDDYWHHWEDVIVGAALGLLLAHICYRQHFPSLYDQNCHCVIEVASANMRTNLSEDHSVQNDYTYMDDVEIKQANRIELLSR